MRIKMLANGGAWIAPNSHENILFMFPPNVIVDVPPEYAGSLIDAGLATDEVPSMARGKDYNPIVRYLKGNNN